MKRRLIHFHPHLAGVFWEKVRIQGMQELSRRGRPPKVEMIRIFGGCTALKELFVVLMLDMKTNISPVTVTTNGLVRVQLH
jgi:hypothetical protein